MSNFWSIIKFICGVKILVFIVGYNFYLIYSKPKELIKSSNNIEKDLEDEIEKIDNNSNLSEKFALLSGEILNNQFKIQKINKNIKDLEDKIEKIELENHNL